MNIDQKLHHLAPTADELLAGLQADEAMRLRILRAARTQTRPSPRRRFAPVAAFAAAMLVCIGVASALPGSQQNTITPMTIGEIAAGTPVVSDTRTVADLGTGANVRAARSGGESLFALGDAEIPVVTANGHIYRMLSTPADIGASLLGQSVATVCVVTDQPSLASGADIAAGLSNVAEASTTVYAVNGISSTTAVAAQVGGSMRLFQRVSYAGCGPAGASFEETFSVRGQVKSLTLSGVGTLDGSKADDVMDILLNCATLKQTDAISARQFLTVTLDSGLRLELGVSGDTLSACGSWSCPEFFEAFHAAME